MPEHPSDDYLLVNSDIKISRVNCELVRKGFKRGVQGTRRSKGLGWVGRSGRGARGPLRGYRGGERIGDKEKRRKKRRVEEKKKVDARARTHAQGVSKRREAFNRVSLFTVWKYCGVAPVVIAI
mgnify:CR=1 FL=1